MARAFVRAEGLREGPGETIRIDRVLRNPANWLETVRPDIYVRGTYLGDGSLSNKTLETQAGQIRNMMSWSGVNRLTVIRPTARGGSYSLLGPSYTGRPAPSVGPVLPPSARTRGVD